MLDSSLRLRYAFVSDPNPIRASPSTDNPNKVDLDVIVTSPAAHPVKLQAVVLQIPCGAGGGGYLSPASLPAAQYDTSGPWTITASGSTVTIEPKGGHGTVLELDGTITFTLPQIVVDATPGGGAVGVTITEHYDQGTGTGSVTITKEPADFVVVDFHALPASLTDIGLTTKLYWTVADAGKQLGYQLRAPGWSPGTTYDATDGVNGVETEAIDDDTDFTLVVLDAGKEAGTVPVTVFVNAPYVDPRSNVKPWLGVSGRFVNMAWATRRTARVSVSIDGVDVDDAAPAYTYHQPYRAIVAGAAGPHTPSIVAHGAGDAEDPHTFPPVSVAASPGVPVGGTNPRSLAISANASVAAVGLGSGSVAIVDLVGRTSRTVSVSGISGMHVSVTTDGKLALDVGLGTRVAIVPLDTGQPQIVTLPSMTYDVAVAPDGSAGVVTMDDAIQLVDVPGKQAGPLLDGYGTGAACAITPDSRLALVGWYDTTGVSVVALPSGPVEQNRIATGTPTHGLAISPDGTFALAWDGASTLTWIDIASRAPKGPPITLPWAFRALAIVPGGQAAIAATPNGLGLIDLGRRRASPTPASVDGISPRDVAISGDGTSVVVLDGTGATVSVL